MSKLIYLDSFRKLTLQNVRLSRILTRNFCDDKSKPEDDKPVPKMNKKAEKSNEKLNSLLKAMLDDNHKRPKIDLTLAKPSNKISKQKKKDLEDLEKESRDLNQNIMKATKDVAEHIGGNVAQTENELLKKLLLRNTDENNASNDVATNLSDLIVGMKFDRSKKPEQSPITTRAQYVRKTLGDKQQTGGERRTKRHRNTNAKMGTRVELFGGVGLGIFKDSANLKLENLLTTSDTLHQRELKLTIMHPPENYFQKMILWTEQGKLWKFPIDNEQGLEEEHNVYFAEHVFLDTHLEGWCPPRGPVRHFMELVCVGLSKNPYLSVQEKKNHIEWFRDYFKEKEELLKEVGALDRQVPKLETDSTQTTT